MPEKGTGPPLFSIDGSPTAQRGYKKLHWEKRDSAGETKRIGATMVESSVLFLVASVSSLEENGTSVVFFFLRFLPDSTVNAYTFAISRSFTREVAETHWNMLVAGGSTSHGR